METIDEPICRVCLKTFMEFIDFEELLDCHDADQDDGLEEKLLVTVADCFRACTMLDVTSIDEEPQILCVNCCIELKTAYKFLQKALQADKILQKAAQPKVLKTNAGDAEGEDDVLEVEMADGDLVVLRHEQEFVEERLEEEFYEITELEGQTRKADESPPDRTAASSTPTGPQAEEQATDGEEAPSAATDDDEFESFDYEDAVFLDDESKDNEIEEDKAEEIYEEPKSPKPEYSSLKEEGSEAPPVKRPRYKRPNNRLQQCCKVCEYQLGPNETMRAHLLDAHSEIVQCNDCEFKGRLPKVLDHRRRVHGQGSNFNCEICGKSFSTNSTLNAHMKYHQRKESNCKSDACHICGKQFASQYYLSYHMSVHGDRREYFQCEHAGCEKMYVSKTALDAHVRLHTGETIACPECGKQFVRQCELNVHMRFHLRDFPFKCEVCGKAYAIKGHLRSHMWKHQGLKLQCEDCGKLFTSAKALQEHSYSHTNQMPFPCSHCEKGYPSKQKYKVHLRRAHQLELDEAEMQKVASNFGPKPMQRKKWTLVQADSVMREVVVKTKTSNGGGGGGEGGGGDGEEDEVLDLE